VLRDPVDRAYSNWTHLWVDGLEPIPDVVDACLAEPRRVDDGWAPFWRYLGLGRYGEQLAALFELFPREQVLIVRYRDLVDTPSEALDRVCRFLGVRQGVISAIPGDNTRPFVMDGWQTRALSSAVRAGSKLGSAFEPKAWRRVSRPLINALHRRGRAHRPALPVDQRQTLLGHFEADLELLEHVTGTSFADWRSEDSEGAFASRVVDQDRRHAS
jgi:sulfotransferase family protein